MVQKRVTKITSILLLVTKIMKNRERAHEYYPMTYEKFTFGSAIVERTFLFDHDETFTLQKHFWQALVQPIRKTHNVKGHAILAPYIKLHSHSASKIFRKQRQVLPTDRWPLNNIGTKVIRKFVCDFEFTEYVRCTYFKAVWGIHESIMLNILPTVVWKGFLVVYILFNDKFTVIHCFLITLPSTTQSLKLLDRFNKVNEEWNTLRRYTYYNKKMR